MAKTYQERLEEYALADYRRSEENGDETLPDTLKAALVTEHEALQIELMHAKITISKLEEVASRNAISWR